jgi:diguanylate cyclase (GGDEF)-like protein/PAS domain S-box-containing protein
VESIKNLKLKLLLLFLLPAVGLVYFSFDHVSYKFKQYRKTTYLDQVTVYVQKSAQLIKALQKERGLSIASLQKPELFRKELEAQRKESDRIFAEYATLVKEPSQRRIAERIKRIVDHYARLGRVREAVDRGGLSLFRILDAYNPLISDLLASTNILKSSFINERFLDYVNEYAEVLRLAEYNGQERALIAYLLAKREMEEPVLRALYRLEARVEESRRRFEEMTDPAIMVEYRSLIPDLLQERVAGLKRRIIYQRQLDTPSSREWWTLSTRYIDGLYRVSDRILAHLTALKRSLKEEAYRALLVSLLLWVIGLGALYVTVLLVVRMIDAYGRQVAEVEEQKLLYKTFSEFSELLLFNENRELLMHTICVILMQLERFSHIWIAKIEKDRIHPACAESVSPALLDQEINEREEGILRLRHQLYHAAETGQYEIMVAGNEPSPLYEEAESFGIFPFYEEAEARYLLVVGIRESGAVNADVLDLILRMVGALRKALDSIALKEKEAQAKEELSIMASVFNAHEAITITDETGTIINVNDAFTRITGYSREEALGKNPNVLKSGKHDKDFYVRMWDSIRKEGYWKGEIYNKRKNGEIYPEMLSISAVRNEEGKATHYVAHFFDITDLKAAQAQAEFRAQHDPLTELCNRQKLHEELIRIYRHNELAHHYGAFIYFDLDNFKHINDDYGHEIGDKVLIEVARRLTSLAYEEDVVARIGGDEFAFVVANLGNEQHDAIKRVSILVEKIQDLFREPLPIDEHAIEVTFSIGVKVFPDGEKDPMDVMVDADVAMYHAKKSGKNQYRFFDERLDLESRQFLVLRKELSDALQKEDEILLHYQPKVDVADGRLVGFEALVRWNHPRKGLLHPDDFLPVTSSNRLNEELTRYVIRHVCRQLQSWRKRYDGWEMTVSVNISGELFNRSDFVERVVEMTEGCEEVLPWVVFEIVEDTLMRSVKRSIRMVEELKAMGIRFSIDDFGTGYSSFNYLGRLPVDELKIDKSFIMEMEQGKNREIVRMIVEVAHLFEMRCVAEGVEKEENLAYLKRLGCDFYQGFLFSGAVTPEEIEARIAQGIWRIAAPLQLPRHSGNVPS